MASRNKIALSTGAAIAAILIAVLAGFSDTASAEDEVCSKLFKSDHLREVCSVLRPKTDRRSDLERSVRMSCGILKIGHENPSPSFPRSSEVIAGAERAVQECIDQFPDLGPLKPAPAPSVTFAQSFPKPRFALGGAEDAAARAACEKSADELEAKGKLDGSGVDRRVMRNAFVKSCVGMERFGTTLQPAPTPPMPSAYQRGLTALDGGDFDAAIVEFTTAIVDDPKDTFSYIRRGTAYERKGDAASAVGDYRKVLKLVDAETGAAYAAKIRKLEKTKK
jgi:tetratricopeptide (TPR) repeat protein